MSCYLDAWRFMLAMVVFLGHVAATRLTGGLLWQLGIYTTEAVSVFFVLSGFVIGYVTDQRETDVFSYAIARAARIYSVALPALCLTFILDAFGRVARPDLYTESWGYIADGRVWQFVSGLLFINRLWGINVPQGSDLAYWSLGCEVWYYAIFGVLLFARGRWRIVGAVGGLLIAGPLTALLFPLWLLGVWGYKVCRTPLARVELGWCLVVASMALWIAYESSAAWHSRLDWLVPYRLHRPQLMQDYIVGVLFVAHLIGFRTVSNSLAPLFASVAIPIRWVAGSTFSLYLFHLPVAQFLASCVSWAPTSLSMRTLIIGGTLAIVFLLAEFTERRKEPWRRIFAYIVSYARGRYQKLSANRQNA